MTLFRVENYQIFNGRLLLIPEGTTEVVAAGKILSPKPGHYHTEYHDLTEVDSIPDTVKAIDFSNSRIKFLPGSSSFIAKALNFLTGRPTPKLPEGLENLTLVGCKYLETISNAPSTLKKLNVNASGIRFLPELSEGLEELDAAGCENLETIPNIPSTVKRANLRGYLSSGRGINPARVHVSGIRFLPELLEGLEDIDLAFCQNLEKIPNIPSTLRKLNLSHTSVRSLPELTEGLEELYAVGCENLETIPNTPSTLKKLNLSYSSIRSLPELKEGLEEFYAVGCKNLETIPNTPSTLKKLNLSNSSIRSLPELSDNLEVIDLSGCDSLEITPELKERLLALEAKGVDICYPDHSRPNAANHSQSNASNAVESEYINRKLLEHTILQRYAEMSEGLNDSNPMELGPHYFNNRDYFIDLTSADPLGELPHWATNIESIGMSKYGDPNGEEAVRESLSGYFRDELGIANASKENVMITQGMNNALIIILKSLRTPKSNESSHDDNDHLFDDDDMGENEETASVASDTNVRENRIALVTAAKHFYTIPNEDYIHYRPLETNFIKGERLNVQALREKLDELTDSKKFDEIVFYLSNPDNPSGSIMTQEEADKISNLLKEEKYKNVVVINDLAYAGTQCATTKIPVVQSERFYTIVGMSKLSGPGYRIAALQINDEQNPEIISTSFSTNLFSNPESQRVLQQFYRSENKDLRDEFLKERSSELSYRSKFMRSLINGIEDAKANVEEQTRMISDLSKALEITSAEALEKLTKGIEGAKVVNNPQGAFFSIIDFPAVLHSKDQHGQKIKNTFDVATTLFNEDKMFLLPAAIFRVGSDKYKIKTSSRMDDKDHDSSWMRVSHSIPVETIIAFSQRLELATTKHIEIKDQMMPEEESKDAIDHHAATSPVSSVKKITASRLRETNREIPK